MNTKLFFSILFTILFKICFAHKEWVHQYQVRQAYWFLENKVGVVQEIKNHLDFNALFDKGDNVDPWDSEYGIFYGAWREDEEDPVYEYSLTNGITASVTHFWRADDGDNATGEIGIVSNAPNAWSKAKFYLFGGHEIFIKKEETLANKTKISGRYYTYPNLIELCKFGTNINTAYKEKITGNKITVTQSTIKTLDKATAVKYSYHILGRVAHLLGDMSVPAHVHNHIHPCDINKPDFYEQYMGDNYCTDNHDYPSSGSLYPTSPCYKDCNQINQTFPAQNYNANTASSAQGGLLCQMFNYPSKVDQIRYLFYSTNQLTDFFTSGVNYFGFGSPFTSQGRVTGNKKLNFQSPITSADLTFLTSTFNSINKGVSPPVIDPALIAHITFNYSIRAIASLFFWFATETGQIPSAANLPLTDFQIPHTYTTTNFPFGFTKIVDETYYNYTMSPRVDDPFNNTITTSNYFFTARNEITAGSIGTTNPFELNNGSIVIFKAGNGIRLKSGFHAKSGSIFRAMIDPSLDVGCAESPFVLRQIGGSASSSIKQNDETQLTASTQRVAFKEQKKTINSNITFKEEEQKETKIKSEKFAIMPNPNNGSFKLTYPYIKGDVEIMVSDITGHKVYNSTSSKNNHQVDLHEQAAGVYLLQVITSEGLFSSKIIVQ